MQGGPLKLWGRRGLHHFVERGLEAMLQLAVRHDENTLLIASHQVDLETGNYGITFNGQQV